MVRCVTSFLLWWIHRVSPFSSDWIMNLVFIGIMNWKHHQWWLIDWLIDWLSMHLAILCLSSASSWLLKNRDSQHDLIRIIQQHSSGKSDMNNQVAPQGCCSIILLVRATLCWVSLSKMILLSTSLLHLLSYDGQMCNIIPAVMNTSSLPIQLWLDHESSIHRDHELETSSMMINWLIDWLIEYASCNTVLE